MSANPLAAGFKEENWVRWGHKVRAMGQAVGLAGIIPEFDRQRDRESGRKHQASIVKQDCL